MKKTIFLIFVLIATIAVFAENPSEAFAPVFAAAGGKVETEAKKNSSQPRDRASLSETLVNFVAPLPKDDLTVTEPAIAPAEDTDASGIALERRKFDTTPWMNPEMSIVPRSAALPPAFLAPLPDGSFCDANYVGGSMTFDRNIQSTLDDLLNQVHDRFGVNFLTAPNIGTIPINIKANDIPWTTLLRSQLSLLGIRATCAPGNAIELIRNVELTNLEKEASEAAKLETRYIKLKYLQPSSSENKNIAGQSSGGGSSGGQGGSGGCQSGGQGGGGQSGGGGQANNIPQRCKFERLMSEIRQILGLNDGAQTAAIGTDNGGGISKRPYVGQVPGRNMLLVNASSSQLKEIGDLISHADVPPFQVIIKGLIYTANEDKLKDIGVQTTITDTGSGRTTGGIFGHTLGSLGTLFDFSTLVGTIDFNVQASALQRDGVISIKSRPFATVLDGDSTELTVGRQVPVLIQAINPIGGAPGTLQILQAANLLSVTPHVIDDEKGNPTAVNLELQLESNDVDQSVNSQGVPAISVRSIQSNFILNQEQTAILGGFTVDSDSRTVTKTPGLGDIPILGELFKRRVRATAINRLYFAISVSVIRYGGVIEPVIVPGANTDPPSLTPELLKRAERAEPKQVVSPPAKTGP
jgi:type II secretory pathway component GspD/PulD (secretin)